MNNRQKLGLLCYFIGLSSGVALVFSIYHNFIGWIFIAVAAVITFLIKYT